MWNKIMVMCLALAVSAYLAAKRSENLRPTTLANYARALASFEKRSASVDLDALDAPELRRYLVALIEAGYRGSSVRLYRTILVCFLRWCAREGYCDPAPWGELVPLPRADEAVPRWLSSEEARRLLEAAGRLGSKSTLVAKRNPALIAMMLDTGARKSELVNMSLADLRLETRAVRISSQCKGRRERILPFSAETLRRLRAYLRLREERYAGSCWLWLSREGRQLSRNQVYELVTSAAKLAGLVHVYPHALRHTTATQLLTNGMDSVHVQAILGHARAETTRRYIHLVHDDLAKAFAPVAVVDRLMAA